MTNTEFAARQFAVGYDTGCADKAELLAQRDELLAALKIARDTLGKPGAVSYEDRIAALSVIHPAIAKAEGR